MPFLTNETLFDIAEKPGHLLILGGGPIGIEMAQAHAGLGCQVTVVEAGSIAAKEDPELVARRCAIVLTAQGVTLIEHAEISTVEAGPVLVLKDGRRIAGTPPAGGGRAAA